MIPQIALRPRVREAIQEGLHAPQTPHVQPHRSIAQFEVQSPPSPIDAGARMELDTRPAAIVIDACSADAIEP
ncbi:MAG: hypothetical protein KC496_21100, partial [Anaerolineae bacterium]|nr:hypothetical protein [Anaerolineae bacterium]